MEIVCVCVCACVRACVCVWWLGKFYGDMGQERLAHTLYYKLFKKDVGVLATMHEIDIPRHTLTFMVHSRDARPY